MPAITRSPSPDPTRCPDCRAALTGREACASCGLALQGLHAERLWDLDVELLQVDARRDALLGERRHLLQLLHGADAAVPAPRTAPEAAVVVPRQEWTPQRVQNLLLGLGGMLLAVAALVFAAVTYERLGAGGRAGVLLVLTAVAVAAVPLLLRRGLSATAETLTAVTLVLAGLDAYGLRRLGVLPGLSTVEFTSLATALVAAAAGAAARVVPVRLAGAASVVLAQLPVPLLLADAGTGPAGVALGLAGVVAVDLAVLSVVRARHLRACLAAACGVVGGSALLLALDAAQRPDPTGGALALVACAALLAGASLLTTRLRIVLTAGCAPVLTAAACAVADVRAEQLPLVIGAAGLVAVLTAARLPLTWRTGQALGGLAVAAASVLGVLEPALRGVLLPLTWLGDPWGATTDIAARSAVGPGMAWDGSLVVPVVLLAAGLSVTAAAAAVGRLREAVVPAGTLAGGAVVLLPLGLDLPLAVGLGLLLAVATGLAFLRRTARPESAFAAVALVVHAALWSTADRDLTLMVLPIGAVVVLTLAARSHTAAAVLAGVAAVLGVGWTACLGAAAGLAQDQVGGVLLLALAALLAAAPALDSARRTGVEAVALLTAGTAVALAVGDVGWLSWVLAGTALLALATALRPDRRAVAAAGALLLSASSWVRLADAGVGAPEPYVLPLAVVALVLGHLRVRAVPTTRSWPAYGAGLTALLLPSLLASLDDATLLRPLLVGAGALAVLLVGARLRLQAPLVLGGTVLAVDALHLLWPYAAALPRWLPLAAAGALLVVIGATYEQRRKDLARVRAGYASLA